MKKLTVYQTSDLKQFTSASEARQHQVELDTLSELKELLSAGVATGRPESVLKNILMEAKAVSGILSRYRKRAN